MKSLEEQSQAGFIATQELRQEALDLGIVLLTQTAITFSDEHSKTGFIHRQQGIAYQVIGPDWTNIMVTETGIPELVSTLRMSLDKCYVVLSYNGEDPFTCVVPLGAAKEFRKLNPDVIYNGLSDVTINFREPSVRFQLEEDGRDYLAYPWVNETIGQLETGLIKLFPEILITDE